MGVDSVIEASAALAFLDAWTRSETPSGANWEGVNFA
jgi:hypothetical protein